MDLLKVYCRKRTARRRNWSVECTSLAAAVIYIRCNLNHQVAARKRSYERYSRVQTDFLERQRPRAVLKKEPSFTEIFETINADVFALQETKLQEGQVELDLPGYVQTWNYADRKGYSGTAVSREKPLCR